MIASTIFSLALAIGILSLKEWAIKSAIIWNISLGFFVTVPSIFISINGAQPSLIQALLLIKIVGSIMLVWLSYYWWEVRKDLKTLARHQ